jgi:hypothetical protein
MAPMSRVNAMARVALGRTGSRGQIGAGVELPSDHLMRCQQLSARIYLTNEAIRQAPLSQIDQAFRDAWLERMKRWAPLRLRCGDWWARNFNYTWGPILDDWEANQNEWEQRVQARTGVAVMPATDVVALPTDQTVSDFFKGLGESGIGKAAAVGVILLGVGGAVGLAWWLGKKG